MNRLVKPAASLVRQDPLVNRIVTFVLRPVAGEWGRRHIPRLGPVKVTLPNGRRLRMQGGPTSALFWNGWDGYEPETTRLFWRLAVEAQSVLDVGAHAGFFSLLASLAGAHVTAVEPNPRTLPLLRSNVGGSVAVVEAAASDRAGVQRFSTTGDVQAHLTQGDDGDVEVALVTIDSLGLLPDLVKVDAEGYEPEVLTGMLQTLRKSHPAVICEILDASCGQRVREVMDPLGYKCYRLTDGGPQLVEGPPVRVRPWRNYLFTWESNGTA